MRFNKTAKNNAPCRCQSNFDKLLEWLDEDRETAGEKYESVRLRLTGFFYSKGSHFADELADETIDRVAGKIEFLLANYEGDPSRYFYGVAKNVFLEFTRMPHIKPLPEKMSIVESSSDSLEELDRYLTESLETLPSKQARLITKYYQGKTKEKIQHRKQLAMELGVSIQTLRVRAFRIKQRLQKQFLVRMKGDSV